MPDTNTRWLIGVFAAAVVAVSVQIDTQIGGLRDELRSGLAEARADRAEMRAASSAEHAEIRAEVRGDMAEVRAEFRADLAEFRAAVREDLRRLDARLRAVEITLGKVDQRLAALERLHEAAGD